jgi:hypothetical protein
MQWAGGLMLALLLATDLAAADLAGAHNFLSTTREAGGSLYRASSGELKGRLLPLSFVDNADYWGEQVCRNSAAICAVTDRYDPLAYTLRPYKSAAGDLQTERVNSHNGINIYDGATWQIAVMLGARAGLMSPESTYELADNQNRLLALGYSGDARLPVPHQHRALSHGDTFIYNGVRIDDPRRAFVFRTLPRSWLSPDPLAGSRFDRWITAVDLPANNPLYRRGLISWTDWKPISGENAWAFLIGPLQAARLYFIDVKKMAHVPFQSLAVQNALAVLPTFAAMQASIGAIHYAPSGTVVNQGDQLVNRYDVAIENNFSVYAGLNILRATLIAQRDHQKDLTREDRTLIAESLRLINAMLHGGDTIDGRRTQGLLSFFRQHAWRDGEFLQGGFANDPSQSSAWVPHQGPRAVDVNTWGIAALGANRIDGWFGFGASFNAWRQVKRWGGYGEGTTLHGVGFSDRDGNGIDAQGNYRRGILSVEWTAGAIVAVREMRRFYGGIDSASKGFERAQKFIRELAVDEKTMLAAVERMQMPNGTYPYASKRYLIPFGWYANPLPSTCSTAWMVMVAGGFDPLAI